MLDPSSRTELFDCNFDAVTMDHAVARCVEWSKAERISHTVLTANAAILCMRRRDPELAGACSAADLTVADGASVVWASRLAGTPLPERVAGVDLMTELLVAASEHQLRVYFLGAKAEVLEKLVARCQQDFPGAVICGYRDGYFGAAEHATVVEQIRESKPHLLFIGMPTPFKEVWAERHRERLDVPVIMGVGGSFDVLAGYVRRAPAWMQSAGMEWSWRLAMEPRKMWKRYLLTNSEFVYITAALVAKRRLGRSSSNVSSRAG